MIDKDQKIEAQSSRTVDEQYLADCDLYVKEQLERIERGDRTLAGTDRDDYKHFLYQEYYRSGCDSLARRLDTIHEGMASAEVIRIFSAVDWEPHFGGWSNSGADMSPLLLRLKKRLSNPLTAEQASVLKEAIDRLHLVTVAGGEYIEPKAFMFQPYLETVLQWLDYATLVLHWPNNASDGWRLFETAYQDRRLQECLALIAAGELPPWATIYCSLQGKWRNEARMAFIERGYFPWPKVNSCRNWWPKLTSPSDEVYQAASPCPRCNRPADRLTWLYYRHNFLVRGWLTICESCHLQVDYFDEGGK